MDQRYSARGALDDMFERDTDSQETRKLIDKEEL